MLGESRWVVKVVELAPHANIHKCQLRIPCHGSGSWCPSGDAIGPPGGLAAQCDIPAAHPPTTKSQKPTYMNIWWTYKLLHLLVLILIHWNTGALLIKMCTHHKFNSFCYCKMYHMIIWSSKICMSFPVCASYEALLWFNTLANTHLFFIALDAVGLRFKAGELDWGLQTHTYTYHIYTHDVHCEMATVYSVSIRQNRKDVFSLPSRTSEGAEKEQEVIISSS